MSTRWVPDEGPPPVWVDLQRGGRADLVPLDLDATQADLERLGIRLSEGVTLNAWDQDGSPDARDDLLAKGVVERDPEGNVWCLRISAWGHESEPP
jgi:hypothetical protein